MPDLTIIYIIITFIVTICIPFLIRAAHTISFIKSSVAWIKMYFGAAKHTLNTLNEHSILLQDIQKELKNNGGQSLKDIVGKMAISTAISEFRINCLLNSCSFGIYECEPYHGKCIYANDKLCDMFGLSLEEMKDFGWLRAIDEKERPDVYESWMKAIKSNYPYSYVYTVINQKTYKVQKCRTVMTTFKDIHNNAMLYYGVVTIIGE